MIPLNEHLEAQHAALPAAIRGQPWRTAAFARFAERGFPTRREERWRYTDLKPLLEERFSFQPEAPDAGTRARVRALLAARGVELPGPRLVFLDGWLDAELSREAPPPGVEIERLADAWDRLPERLEASSSDHVLATLNAAFVEHGVTLKIARGARAVDPIQLVFAGSGRSRIAAQPRVFVELAEGAQATIVQHFLDLDDAGSAWLNLVTEVKQAAASTLTLYRLQQHGTQALHTSLLRARLARDARLTAGFVDHGGRLVRNDVDVELAEPGAETDLFGVLLADGKQHVDNHVSVDHAAPRTTSNEAFRAIIDDRAHGVFSGKVVVRPGAQKTDARQSSDNLLLSAQAEIDTKPELEIYADDVKCSHGATVGELDEDHLFYLRSRGLPESAARALLTFAFAHAALERIALPALRERAVREIAGELPEPFFAEIAP